MFPEIEGSEAQKKTARLCAERFKTYAKPRSICGYGLNFMKTADKGGRVIGIE